MTRGADFTATKPVTRAPSVRPVRDWVTWLIVLANAVYATIMTGQSITGVG